MDRAEREIIASGNTSENETVNEDVSEDNDHLFDSLLADQADRGDESGNGRADINRPSPEEDNHGK